MSLVFFLLLKKNNFLTFFRLELKKSGLELIKKWAGIKYFGLELIFFLLKIGVFKYLFFSLKKKLFFNTFSAGIKEKRLAGIKYLGLELIIFY